MIEKERKFLLRDEYRHIIHGIPTYIEQGYLMFDGGKHLRIRIINHERCYLGFKNVIDPTYRIEYEYEIPYNDGYEMMNSTKMVVCKERYKIKDDRYPNYIIEVDHFENDIAIVEVEYKGEFTIIPEICGIEVTGDSTYSNIKMAIDNSKL